MQSIKKAVIDNLPISNDDREILNRRLNKLTKDPKSFLRGSYNKRREQIVSKTPIKHKGNNNFTVVSAVYNVEKYLDDYFKSLVGQSLSFKRHIQLILVDDGSTDSSADIIKRWQRKYPKNITYIYKENGGQASARNLGIKYVNTNWVTFIDPDDFISLDYFSNVDIFISKEKNVSLVSCPFIFYFEDLNISKDSHPLKYRFDKKDRILKISNLNEYVQLSVNSAFFKIESIRLNNIKFNEKVKPNFEDAKFVGDYTTRIDQESKVAFIKDSNYFYRKRSDGTSTLDGAWKKPSLYSDVLSEGCLPMLEEAYNKFGYVPKHLQKTVLYHLSWYFKYIVDNDAALDFIDDKAKSVFLDLLKKIFLYIDNETVLSFNLSGIWFLQKVGILGSLKSEYPRFQIGYIENIDRGKKQILVSYFTYFDTLSSFAIDSVDTVPIYEKTIDHKFAGQVFVKEKRCWIPYKEENKLLTANLEGKSALLTLKGKQYKNGVLISDIFKDRNLKPKFYDKSWLLIDRDNQADDNAEHMYRYIMNNHPEQLIYFALRKESHDWQRLRLEGFNLLDFGSESFENALKGCDKIISSNIDGYITDYFGDGSTLSKDFVFLQHGVILHDLSKWLNTKKKLNLFVTSTTAEYNSICSNESLYIFTEKETKLTGLPRHDNLLKFSSKDLKNIVIMPTWRNNIVGKAIDANTRTYNDEFINSQYFKSWKDLLDDERFEKLVSDNGYKVIFAPHPNIKEYLVDFAVPEYIDVWQYSDGNIQKLFQESSMMITDYSSVAFELAYLEKPVIYYQFDRDEVFSGAHTFSKGYFSYEEDGFGPIVTVKEELLYELEKLLDNGSKPFEPYKTRMENTFAYRDTNNCARVYNAITALDEPDNSLNFDITYRFANQAYISQDWQLVESRSQLLINCVGNKHKEWAKSIHIESLFNQHEFSKTIDFLKANYDNSSELVKSWNIKIAFATANWSLVVSEMSNIAILDINELMVLAYSASKIEDNIKLSEVIVKLESEYISTIQSYMLHAWNLRARRKWDALINFLEDKVIEFNIDELKFYQPQVLIAESYRHLGMYVEAQENFNDFESHTLHNPRCRIEIARLRYDQKDYDKAAMQYFGAHDKNINLFSKSYAIEYVQSLFYEHRLEELGQVIEQLSLLYPQTREWKLFQVKSLTKMSKWKEAIEVADKCGIMLEDSLVQDITLAKYRLGLIEEAHAHSVKPTFEHPYNYWKLVSEISMLVQDTELAEYCYKGMIAIYPNYDSLENWSKLNDLRYRA